MVELLTAAQMRAIEHAAIASGEVTGLELMERAGRGVVEALWEWRPELARTSHRAAVLCGPGNNGGDGFVVARLLRERGWDVEVFLYGDEAKLPPDAADNCRRWRQMGKVRALEDYPDFDEDHDLYVDALFGTGLTRPLSDAPLRVLRGICAHRHREVRLVSIDILSGVCADSGHVLGGYDLPHPALIVTFERWRAGHFLDRVPAKGSAVSVKPIGLDSYVWPVLRDEPQIDALNLSAERLACAALSKAGHGTAPHKYHHGHALVLSGPSAQTGAARLAARGALRIGAGLVSVGASMDAMSEHAAHLTAIMLREIDGPDALLTVLEDERLNALCLGPGMGIGEATRQMVLAALTAGRATVLDADALTVFEEYPEILFEALHDRVVLTPHSGEFRRLFPDIASRLADPATTGPAYSKVDASRDAARRAGCVVLFKGADTVIADPMGNASINSAYYERAAPWLATAGSGDVLAGFITGLLARGFDPKGATETAAWLHVECARKFGPGLIAEDIPEQLPAVFRDLGL